MRIWTRIPSKFRAAWQRSGKAICIAVLALSATGTQYAANLPEWPNIPLPASVITFGVSDALVIDGLPIRVRGFVSEDSPAILVQRFHDELGDPLVQDRLAQMTLLGRAMGGFYLTIGVQASQKGSRGFIAIADRNAVDDEAAHSDASTQTWLARMPAGTQVLTHVQSRDGKKASQFWVAANRLPLELNRERVVALLEDRGLRLEKQISPDARDEDTPYLATVGSSENSGNSHPRSADGQGETIFFSGAGKQAIAVVSRNHEGDTTIVINSVTELEAFRVEP